MATPLDRLLETISREHFPHPPATPEEIEAFEQRVGWPLDPDLRTFYLHCNGAELFKPLPETPYRILSLSQIVRGRVALFGKKNDDDAHGPASMWALCDVQDGNYLLVDVTPREDGHYPVIDGWREAWPDSTYCDQIANRFSDFLDRALCEGPAFWLND